MQTTIDTYYQKTMQQKMKVVIAAIILHSATKYKMS